MEKEEKLTDLIESSIKSIEHLTLINKKRRGRGFLETEILKKVEDGILDNIHKASKHQLDLLKNRYKFKFYDELNNKELLELEIKNRVREKNLSEILN